MTTIDVPDPGPDRLADLRRELARRADRAGLLDLAHRTVDGPIGSCLVVVGPAGLLRVAFEVEDHESVLADLADAVSPPDPRRRPADRPGGPRARRVLRRLAP